MATKDAIKKALQDGQNIERKAWRGQLRAIQADLNDSTNDDHYNMTAQDVVERLRIFAMKREKRTRARKGGG